jgi:hypothetical protein
MQPGPLGLGRPHRGGTVLTLGIVSLALNLMSAVGGLAFAPCCFVTLIPVGLGIPAWVMANTDLRLMRQGEMDASGMSQTAAGRICAIISICLSALGLLLSVLAIALGLAVFGAAAAGAAAGNP